MMDQVAQGHEPITDAGWVKEGDAHLKTNEYEEAIRCYEKAIAINKDNAVAWGHKGDAYYILNELDMAVDCYKVVSTLEPDNIIVVKNVVRILFRQGRFDNALLASRAAISLDGNDDEAWFLMANILRRLGRKDEAIMTLKGKVDYIVALGCLLIDEGRTVSARALAEEAIGMDITHPDVWTLKGDADFADKAYVRAIASYDRALEINARDAIAWTRKGATFMGLERYDEAVQAFNEALKVIPGDVEVLTLRGDALFKLGIFSSAIKCYDQVLAKYPDDMTVLIRKADAQLSLSMFEDAARTFAKIVERDPAHAKGWLGLGEAQMRLGHFDRALDATDKALGLDPSSFIAWYQKAIIHYIIGEYDDAHTFAMKAATLSQGSKKVEDLVRMIRSTLNLDLASLRGEVEEVFLVYKDGRMIFHKHRYEKEGMEDHVIGSMLSAVQNFIKDGFHESEGELGKLEMGDLTILVEYWQTMFIAVIVRGEPPAGLKDLMRQTLVKMHDKFYGYLKTWDGSMEVFDGIEPLVSVFFENKDRREPEIGVSAVRIKGTR
jgi:tetratricopeptide (TPR) repeat protein